MDTNFLGLVRLLKEILHDMKKRKRGHIVVISSVMGILGSAVVYGDKTLSYQFFTLFFSNFIH